MQQYPVPDVPHMRANKREAVMALVRRIFALVAFLAFTPAAFGAWFFQGIGGLGADYDAATDVFSSAFTVGRIDPVFPERSRGSDLFATALVGTSDIFGSFAVSVIVDETEVVRDGAFSLIGRSARLGITTDTILLSGSVSSIIAQEASQFVHMRGSFDFIAPQWEAFAGHADVGDIYLAMSPGVNPSFYTNHCVGGCSSPWAGSARFGVFSNSPGIYGTAAVSEPATAFLACVMMLPLLFARRFGWRLRNLKRDAGRA
jgi:hypothetical protein